MDSGTKGIPQIVKHECVFQGKVFDFFLTSFENRGVLVSDYEGATRKDSAQKKREISLAIVYSETPSDHFIILTSCFCPGAMKEVHITYFLKKKE